jgi:hypothetical protein
MFEKMTTKIDQILADVKQIDLLVAARIDKDDAEFLHLTTRLTEALGADGAAAVTGAKHSLKRESPQIEDYSIDLIRREVIEFFITENERARQSHSRPGIILPFRARMLALAASSKPLKFSKPKATDIAKSGFAQFFYWIFAFVAWCIGAVKIHEINQVEFPNISLYGLWGLTVVFYIIAMLALWRGLTSSLRGLVESQPHKLYSGSTVITGYIASAVVVGLTAILLLLLFDYQSHSAAAVLSGEKEKAVAKILSRDSSLWRITPTSPPEVKIDSNFVADFGGFAGTFGDFFGGVLNPVLTFGTLIALAITILMQRTQLLDEKQRANESADVSNLQVFETTFFNLLNLHSTTIADLQFHPSSVKLPSSQESMLSRQSSEAESTDDMSIVRGRSVFGGVVQKIYDLSNSADIGHYLNAPFFGVRGIYKLIQDKHNHVLGHYFRNLYQVLAYVDHYQTPLKADDVTDEYYVRKRYTNILRAQLSAHELSLLFYNCDAEMVDNGEFRKLLIEYEFLEHIPLHYSYLDHDLYIEGHKSDPVNWMIDQYLGNVTLGECSTGAFGKNPAVSAFLKMRKLLRLEAPFTAT